MTKPKASNRKKLVAFVLPIIKKEKLPMSEELEKLKHKQYVAEHKSRKVYDLDENGERIRPPSGNRKNHKEDKSYYRHFTVIILQNHIDAPTLPRYPIVQILLTKVVVLTVITTTFSG